MMQTLTPASTHHLHHHHHRPNKTTNPTSGHHGHQNVVANSSRPLQSSSYGNNERRRQDKGVSSHPISSGSNRGDKSSNDGTRGPRSQPSLKEASHSAKLSDSKRGESHCHKDEGHHHKSHSHHHKDQGHHHKSQHHSRQLQSTDSSKTQASSSHIKDNSHYKPHKEEVIHRVKQSTDSSNKDVAQHSSQRAGEGAHGDKHQSGEKSDKQKHASAHSQQRKSGDTSSRHKSGRDSKDSRSDVSNRASINRRHETKHITDNLRDKKRSHSNEVNKSASSKKGNGVKDAAASANQNLHQKKTEDSSKSQKESNSHKHSTHTSDRSNRKSNDNRSNSKHIDDRSSRKSTENQSSRKSDNGPSSRKSTDDRSSRKSTDDRSSRKSTDDRASRKSTDDRSSRKSTNDQSSRKSTNERSSRNTNKSRSSRKISDDQSKHKTTDTISKRKSSDTRSNMTGSDRLPISDKNNQSDIKHVHTKSSATKIDNACDGGIKAASVFTSRRNTHLDTHLDSPRSSSETSERTMNEIDANQMDINEPLCDPLPPLVVPDKIAATGSEQTVPLVLNDIDIASEHSSQTSPQRSGDQNIFDIVGSFSPPERLLEYVDADNERKSLKVPKIPKFDLKEFSIRIKRLRSPQKYKTVAHTPFTRQQLRQLSDFLDGGSRKRKLKSASLMYKDPTLFDAEYSDNEDTEGGDEARGSDEGVVSKMPRLELPIGAPNEDDRQRILNQHLLPMDEAIRTLPPEEENDLPEGESAEETHSSEYEEEEEEDEDELPDLSDLDICDDGDDDLEVADEVTEGQPPRKQRRMNDDISNAIGNEIHNDIRNDISNDINKDSYNDINNDISNEISNIGGDDLGSLEDFIEGQPPHKQRRVTTTNPFLWSVEPRSESHSRNPSASSSVTSLRQPRAPPQLKLPTPRQRKSSISYQRRITARRNKSRHFLDILAAARADTNSGQDQKENEEKNEEEEEKKDEQEEANEEIEEKDGAEDEARLLPGDEGFQFQFRKPDAPFVRRRVRLAPTAFSTQTNQPQPSSHSSKDLTNQDQPPTFAPPLRTYTPTAVQYNQYGQPYRNCIRNFTRNKNDWLYSNSGCGSYQFEPLQKQEGQPNFGSKSRTPPRQSCIVVPMSTNQRNAVDAQLEEVGDNQAARGEGGSDIDYLLHVLEAVEAFTRLQQEPPNDLIAIILNEVLFKADSVSTVYAAYNFLIRLLRMHPPKDSLPFEWSDIENAVANLKLRLGIQHVKDRLTLLKNKLALHYMVECIEAEFLNRPVGSRRQVCKSKCYRLLSTEISSCQLRSIVQWLVSALTYGDYCTLADSMEKQLRIAPTGNTTTIIDKERTVGSRSGDNKKEEGEGNIKQVAPTIKLYAVIEKLLDLSLAVSSERGFDDYATELSIEYNHLYSVARKAFLVENISNPQLRFMTVCKVLDRCENDAFFGVRPVKSLDDIISKYFGASPPRIPETPPPTPEHEKGEGDTDVSVSSCEIQGIEELAMLFYNCLASYILLRKGRRNDASLESADLETLTNLLPNTIKQLESRLRQVCPPEMRITPTTQRYLSAMEALGDVT